MQARRLKWQLVSNSSNNNKMSLISFIKKLFFMDKPKHKLLKFVAKRKYWIEWHFAFNKYPSKERKDLDKLHEFLEKYIERYLDKYFDKCHKHEGPGVKGYH